MSTATWSPMNECHITVVRRWSTFFYVALAGLFVGVRAQDIMCFDIHLLANFPILFCIYNVWYDGMCPLSLHYKTIVFKLFKIETTIEVLWIKRWIKPINWNTATSIFQAKIINSINSHLITKRGQEDSHSCWVRNGNLNFVISMTLLKDRALYAS